MKIYLDNVPNREELKALLEDQFPGIEVLDKADFIISFNDKYLVFRKGMHDISTDSIEELVKYLKQMAPYYLQEFVD